MYIKFWRSYGEDKKDEANGKLSSDLSVELEGEKGKQSEVNTFSGKQTEGNIRLYRAVCLFLTIICLILLLVVIVLSTKLCTEREETAPAERKPSPFAPTCSQEECQALFPNIQPQHLGCRQCANGWLTFGTSCFYLSTFRLSWDESQRNCSSRGGALAVVSNKRVQSFLTTKGKMQYWIGLRQKGAKWSWVNNAVLQESFWADPTSEGNCGVLDTESPPEKNWDRASCELSSYFICQLHL
ncbi:early activation antigen CD69 [Centropristis striata]|uniref:early activation antigen CD69 n=1 Tax=Centropristis striata TaxID=184440 RepID=UPI0027E1A559|nr:early activation antigen CD69 [Centropristis striata]